MQLVAAADPGIRERHGLADQACRAWRSGRWPPVAGPRCPGLGGPTPAKMSRCTPQLELSPAFSGQPSCCDRG
eukprot:3223908-Alexandrium_andersonii.AAC.1